MDPFRTAVHLPGGLANVSGCEAAMREFYFFDHAGGGKGWRQLPADELPGPGRWDRAVEPFEVADDVVPGETVLRDLGIGTQTAGSATRILARFAALRFLAIALERPRPLSGLARERRLAAQYTSVLRAPPAEARALRAVVALARFAPPRRLLAFLNDAGAAAHRSRHGWGAFAVYRAAYRLGADRGWHAEAATAAHGIAVIAEAANAGRSARLWRRRARVLERRVTAA
jgi:hypothetical protein